MSKTTTLAIISDIHYAGANEQARGHEFLQGVDDWATLLFLKAYRRYFWLKEPFAHNHLLDRFITETTGADYVVANGDYCCNVAYLGVRDDGTFESAFACLQKLRRGFGPRFFATIGDHELGKKKMGGEAGGLSLASWERTRHELALEPFWEFNVGNYRILGVVSTLIAMPIYGTEAAAGERPEWQALSDAHLQLIEKAFRSLKAHEKVILFCHDPSALPYLYQLEAVRAKLPQIERTIIGHLHSPVLVRQSQLLSRIPLLNFGHTSRRITSALRQVRLWKEFKILLCPAPFGVEIAKDGGYYTAELDPSAVQPARFIFHPFPR